MVSALFFTSYKYFHSSYIYIYIHVYPLVSIILVFCKGSYIYIITNIYLHRLKEQPWRSGTLSLVTYIDFCTIHFHIYTHIMFVSWLKTHYIYKDTWVTWQLLQYITYRTPTNAAYIIMGFLMWKLPSASTTPPVGNIFIMLFITYVYVKKQLHCLYSTHWTRNFSWIFI